MTATSGLALPTITTHPEADSFHRKLGPALAGVGLVVAVATAVANWSTISDIGVDDGSVAETGMWAGGFGIAGLGIIKIAIAIVLVGIIHRLWGRAESMVTTVPRLRALPGAAPVHGTDARTVTSDGPVPALPIHRWQPACGSRCSSWAQ